MNQRETTAIAIKFFGIYLLVNMVLYVPMIVLSATGMEQFTGEEVSEGVLITIVGSFMLLGVAVSAFLWRLANSMVSADSDRGSEPSALTQGFLLQLLGIYFLVDGLSELPMIGFSAFQGASEDDTAWLYFLAYVFEVGVGLYLLVRPAVWWRWLHKLRGHG